MKKQKEELDFAHDLQIDVDDLVNEWTEMPSLFMLYAQTAAQAKLDLQRLKQRVSSIKSEVDNEIRQNPATFGITKVTEAAITAVVSAHPLVKEAEDEMYMSEYHARVLSDATEAMKMRESALENLVKLHGQGYYTSSVAKNMVGDASQVRTDLDRSSVKAKMLRRQDDKTAE